MTPHSTAEDVEASIHEVNTQTRRFITINDARAIASWYVDPKGPSSIIQFAQGTTVQIQDLMLDVLHLAELHINQDQPETHMELLHLLAFVAMRSGITNVLDGRE